MRPVLPHIAVVGAGIVGARVARDLLVPGLDGSAGVRAVTLVTRRRERADELRRAFGTSVTVVVGERPDLGDADVVVVAREPRQQMESVGAALADGRDVVATGDDPDEVTDMLRLHGDAVERGRVVVAGAAMSPGLTCLLARHGSALLDRVDEIHVARDGAAGPACARQRLRALRGSAQEWRDGAWVRRAGFSGRELCWFPDPIGARDCYRAELAEPVLLADAFGEVQRVSARLAASPIDRVLAPLPVWIGPPPEGGHGAVRVELRGVREGGRETVVYGVLDRPAVAASATAAVLALHVGSRAVEPGCHGAAAIADPLPLLRELARRGVRAAVFEGAGTATSEAGFASMSEA